MRVGRLTRINRCAIVLRERTIMRVAIGLVLMMLAATLVYFGRPDKDGNSPRLLRFNAALVLYPPVVLVASAFGVAELVYSMLG